MKSVMASPSFLFQVIICMICTVHLSVAIDDPVPYNIVNCSETSRSSIPAFQANLNSTLHYLISNSSTGKGFYRASSGTGVDTAAYGIFLCRGDSSGEECQTCVINSTKNILSRCPNHKEAIIWSNHCMLRFSNRYIFSKLEEQPTGFVDNRGSATEPNRFYAMLGELMGRLISEAVSSPARKFYAVDNDTIPESNNSLYGLVQCTPDITEDDCRACLRHSLGLVRENGLIVLKPSCRFRFEVFPFYDTPSSLSWKPHAGGSGGDNMKRKRLLMIIIAICIPTAVILALILIIRRSVMRRKYDFANQERVDDEISSPTGESVQFDFGTIEAATNKFSVANKIGEGGFGPVYQGSLPYGQKIAIKRLSEGSNQGGQEFKNEVEVVAKLQHRNLVRLLGFCLHEKEKILVYEYVPNKSLDYFLLDAAETQQQLDWETRIKIIQGIARGLLYLHEDSRLRIIHRDLKASNVLLDENMNPKISDFGTARILKVDQIQESTNRIVGTYGYMSPEYALDGNFSVKSDVFSFGVLMLEIISGKKNRNVSSLLRHAWRQWREELVLELVDFGLRGSCPVTEVTRCVHIALLCVEEDPADRPTMAIAVTMLNTFSFPLPTPKKPTCFAYSNGSESYMPKIASESDELTNKLTSCTVPR